MASAQEPPEEMISLLMAVTEMDRSQAIRRLRANNNDANRAMNEYMDNPNSVSQYTWDESQFASDREGEVNNTGIAFNIQGPDDAPVASYHGSAAPTRPPSRADNRSPLGRLVDLTAFEAGAPTNTTQEDADLERALRESAAESGVPQETGIVDSDANVKYFGPANRPEYDTEQWAMVPTKTEVESVNQDLRPSARKRQPGAPAFLRQTKDHRLGHMLVVYHSIPLMRNILLQCGRPAAKYGYTSEWWKGQPILKHEALVAMARGEVVWGDDTHPDFCEELHRLMAFLDNTERSFGTVDALAETKAIDPSYGSWMQDVEEKLIPAVQEEGPANPDFDLDPVMSTGRVRPILTPPPEEQPTEMEDEDKEVKFGFLDVSLEEEPYSWVNTLYDALDHLFWQHALSTDHSFPEEANFAFIDNVSQVITIRMAGAGLNRPCEIPETLYLDRYMQDHNEIAIHFQTQINMVKRQGFQKLAQYQEDRVRCRGEQGCSKYNWLEEPHDVRECYGKIIDKAKYSLERLIRDAQWRYSEEHHDKDAPYSVDDLRLIHTWTGPYKLTQEEQNKVEELQQMIQVSQEKIEAVNNDLTECEARKKEYQRFLEVINTRLTCQEDEADDEKFVFRSQPGIYRPEYWNPIYKYSLRGVALTKDLAYVCVREEPDLIEIDESESASKDQWWKLEYVADDGDPVKVEKATLDNVLLAAGTGSKHPILTYASEAAMQTEPIRLSDALRMFVKADNKTFQQELAQEQSAPAVPEAPEVLEGQPVTAEALQYTEAINRNPYASPAKRKHSIGSSVATNGSSGGDPADLDMSFSDPNDPFIDDEQGPSSSHREYSNSVQHVEDLSGVVESLGNRRIQQHDSPVLGRRDLTGGVQMPQPRRPSNYGVGSGDTGSMEEMQEFSSTSNAARPNGVEMQERNGGPMPFLSRTNGAPGTQASPIDLMDVDLEAESQGH